VKSGGKFLRIEPVRNVSGAAVNTTKIAAGDGIPGKWGPLNVLVRLVENGLVLREDPASASDMSNIAICSAFTVSPRSCSLPLNVRSVPNSLSESTLQNSARNTRPKPSVKAARPWQYPYNAFQSIPSEAKRLLLGSSMSSSTASTVHV
jgi:hypothetical protein